MGTSGDRWKTRPVRPPNGESPLLGWGTSQCHCQEAVKIFAKDITFLHTPYTHLYTHRGHVQFCKENHLPKSELIIELVLYWRQGGFFLKPVWFDCSQMLKSFLIGKLVYFLVKKGKLVKLERILSDIQHEWFLISVKAWTCKKNYYP